MQATVKEPTTLEKIAQRRDELRVQMHLARAEARDEWEILEEKWHSLKRQLEPVEEASVETVKDLGSAARLLMEELWEGYGRIRNAIREKRAS
jgi:hypothetical protein